MLVFGVKILQVLSPLDLSSSSLLVPVMVVYLFPLASFTLFFFLKKRSSKYLPLTTNNEPPSPVRLEPGIPPLPSFT